MLNCIFLFLHVPSCTLSLFSFAKDRIGVNKYLQQGALAVVTYPGVIENPADMWTFRSTYKYVWELQVWITYALHIDEKVGHPAIISGFSILWFIDRVGWQYDSKSLLILLKRTNFADPCTLSSANTLLLKICTYVSKYI